MDADDLAEATAEFDRELVISQSRALSPGERGTWREVRRKPGRPRRGAGAKVISVSVERGLLSKSDATASRLGISRAALIERGLRLVLARLEDSRESAALAANARFVEIVERSGASGRQEGARGLDEVRARVSPARSRSPRK
jgi:hypothetical protein